MTDYVDVIKLGRDVEVPDTNRVPRPDIQVLIFIPGGIREGELKRLFGGIKGAFDNGNNDATTVTCDDRAEGNDDKTNMSDFVGSIKREACIKLTPIASFNHSKHDGIHAMFCPGSGTGLFKFEGKNSVKLCNRSGNIKAAINLGTKTEGFTVTSDNRLLFCCTSQQCIKEMELPNGDITETFSTSPLTPSYICTGPSGDIYVTMYDEHDYDVTDDSTRVLVRYDSQGRNKTQCQVDGNGRNIFVVPCKVCVNRSGTQIAVINHVNERRSELVVLDKYLSPILIYTGPSVLTGDALAGYVLSCVVFDTRDNIWIAECYSKTVKLLSPTCEPLQVLLTMETSPWSLSLHGDEVWVGDG
ncbi:uncharacterized protein LOC110441419 [Mizuhopecten yessoensis]|uniref:uncharacterized protein LOC110441419 n=1 Tax=Mizuhopecten yessoensis TaxID=6573 RepID=UPI000B45E054|nr:uncharacterized protein LOC110441419 [Mizuhopecten yessoensis]XP_021340218.1 uncharacterized protein LOC110441419 [Mizuhopecten yessoensis]